MGQIFSTPGNPMDEQLYTGTHEIFTCQVQVITAVLLMYSENAWNNNNDLHKQFEFNVL